MYEKHIRRGMILLDEEVPGWDKRIDLKTLDMRSEQDCILGQLFGSLEQGASALSLTMLEQVGFCALAFNVKDPWGQLTKEWRQAVEKR